MRWCNLLLALIALSFLVHANAWAQDTDDIGYAVDAAYAVIWDYAGDTACGHECSRFGHDNGADTVTPDITQDLAELFVRTALEYDVPVLEILATAGHESSFQPRAVGPGGECGLWQQTPRYVHDDWWPEGEPEDRCLALFDPEIAARVFALNYHHRNNLARRAGRPGNWAGYYKGGRTFDSGYNDRHDGFLRRFERIYTATLVELVADT